MRPRALVLLGIVLAMGAGTAASASSRSAQTRLQRALEHEHELTERSVAVERRVGELEREHASLGYTSALLRHSRSEAMRRLTAYRAHRRRTEARTRQRARTLYKLSRGGLAQWVLEESVSPGATASRERLARGHALRYVVRHDLRELRGHQRAESKALAELAAAIREQQTVRAVETIRLVEADALAAVRRVLEPELQLAHRRRVRLIGALPPTSAEAALSANRALLGSVRHERAQLRRLKGLGMATKLVAPVPGGVVGGFGDDRDRVLRLPIVRNGVELDARKNRPVRALAEGEVVLVTELPNFDTAVVIDHGGGHYSLTARLWRPAVEAGLEVAAGDILGYVAPKRIDDGLGDTIYFEVRHGEKPVDPAPYLRAAK